MTLSEFFVRAGWQVPYGSIGPEVSQLIPPHAAHLAAALAGQQQHFE